MDLRPTELFAALANDARLRCLLLLLRHGALCVCELTYATGAVQPHVSRYLAQLREQGLVADRRGLWVYYRIHYPSGRGHAQQGRGDRHDPGADDERRRALAAGDADPAQGHSLARTGPFCRVLAVAFTLVGWGFNLVA
jgi:DNA-binding transcriptional ArsR family regulator